MKCPSSGCAASGAAITKARNKSGICCGSSAAIATCTCARSEKPEFDAWRWNDYWVPLESVIEFKRDVYQLALNELAKYLHRNPHEKTPERRQRALKRSPRFN